MGSPTWEKHIPSDVCSPIWKHMYRNRNRYPPPGKHISLMIYVRSLGKQISLVICAPPPGKHISLAICVPLPGKHISLALCVPLPGGKLIPSDMCSFQNIVKDIFLAYIFEKKKVLNFSIFLNFLFLQPRKAFFRSRIS